MNDARRPSRTRFRLPALPALPSGPSPVLAAAAASAIAVGLVVASRVWTGRHTGWFLVWNLFLAWLPLGFAVLAERPWLGRRARWGWAILWLLFYPNAPYIFTDLTHLDPDRDPRFWVEMCVVLLFALTGLIVGFLSLHRMQRLVTRHYGRWAGWWVVGLAALLGSAGVAVGRFLRWNSWDALTRPWQLTVDVGGWLYHLPDQPQRLLFLGLFSLFLFLAYVMIHNLAALGDREPCGPER